MRGYREMNNDGIQTGVRIRIVVLQLALVSVVAMARAEESIFAFLPCVDSSYRAVIPSGPDDKMLKDFPRGPHNIIVKVLNLPAGSESNDMRVALERGIYGCGQDRLVVRQSFTPKRFAEQLKMLNDLFGRLTSQGCDYRWLG